VDSVVLMPAGVSPGDVALSKSGSYLVLSYPGGQVWFSYWFSHSSAHKFAEVRFADSRATAWTPQDVAGLLS
jgi:uncharacterized protein YjlB